MIANLRWIRELVPIKALVLTGLANFGVVGYPETEPPDDA
jgi:hypothetical protein